MIQLMLGLNTRATVCPALGVAKTATTTIGSEETGTQLPDVTVPVLKLNLPIPFSPKSS
jgi:hypothetical protein